MCNYTYKIENAKLNNTPCIYPSFYKKHSAHFLRTKELPIDHEGYCIFHSKDIEWKNRNLFKEKVKELFNVLAEIISNDGKYENTYNFCGFYFSEPLILDKFSLKNSLDFRFCEFLKGVTINDSKISGSIDISNASFHDIFLVKDVDFKNSIYGSNASFFNGVSFYNCQFENYTYFDNCIFKKGNEPVSREFTIKNSNDKKDNSVEYKKSIRYLNFENSKFEVLVNFQGIIFDGDVAFDNCTFLDEFYFQKNEINGTIRFNESEFLLSHIINPIYGSVDFRDIKLNKDGKLEFKGNEPLYDMVKGEMYITFETEPEGTVSFENFNLNKISPKNKVKIIDLKKTEKVIIGVGCGIYRYRTNTKEIQVLKHNQNLIEDFLKTYTRFLTINKSISLGVEIEIRAIDFIRFYYYTDDPNVSEEAFYKIFEEQTEETINELTNRENTNNKYEEYETKLDILLLFVKMRFRKDFGFLSEQEIIELCKAVSENKTNSIYQTINYNIDMSKKVYENVSNKNGILVIGDGTNNIIRDNKIVVNKGNKDELKNALKQKGLEDDKINSLVEILDTEPQDKENKIFGTKLKTWVKDIGAAVGVEVVKQILFNYLAWPI